MIQAHKGSTEKNTNLLVETARATQLFGACLGRVEKTTGFYKLSLDTSGS